MGDTNQYRRDHTNEFGGISKYMRGVTLVTLGDTSEYMRGVTLVNWVTLVNCGTQVGTLVPAAAGSSQRLRGRGRRWGGNAYAFFLSDGPYLISTNQLQNQTSNKKSDQAEARKSFCVSLASVWILALKTVSSPFCSVGKVEWVIPMLAKTL